MDSAALDECDMTIVAPFGLKGSGSVARLHSGSRGIDCYLPPTRSGGSAATSAAKRCGVTFVRLSRLSADRLDMRGLTDLAHLLLWKVYPNKVAS